MKKLAIVGVVLLGLLAGPVFAAKDPQALVEETSQLMLAKLREEKVLIKAEPNRIYDLVDQIIIPHFDFEYMSQMVLAKHWRRASAKQRQAFSEEFKQLLVRTYATSLNEYADQEISYLPFRPGSDASQAMVKTEIAQAGGFPIPIDYRLRENSGSWLVFDVVIDGVSLVTNYRTTFAKEIRSGDLDALIQTLAKRNQDTMSQ